MIKESFITSLVGASKSVGFIRFDQRAEAEAAINATEWYYSKRYARSLFAWNYLHHWIKTIFQVLLIQLQLNLLIHRMLV